MCRGPWSRPGRRAVFSSRNVPGFGQGHPDRGRIRQQKGHSAALRAGQGNGGTGPSMRFAVPSFLRHSVESLFSVLFPADCRLCARPLSNISRLPVCLECLQKLRPFGGRRCFTCGELLTAQSVPGFEADSAAKCGMCQRVQPAFERAVSYGAYDGELRSLIHLFKYSRVRTAAQELGRLLGETVSRLKPELGDDKPLVVPVPLHKGRSGERGFNQAERIAKEALPWLPFAVELRPELLERRRSTKSQTGLTKHQRRENVRGAFHVPYRRLKLLKERNVILVDDVMTTGTTAEECARVLKRAGAERVWVATVARVSKYDPFALAIAEAENTLDPAVGY